MKRPRLRLTESRKIHQKEVGLTEPSGLSCDPQTGTLWTVSDGVGKLFELNPDGIFVRAVELAAGPKDYEGVVCLPGGRAALVCEERSEILIVDRATGKTETSNRLADMSVPIGIPERLMTDNAGKDGLEGLSFDERAGHFVVITERDPRLMIEISNDLATVLSVLPLDPQFKDGDKNEDISGITYDRHRQLFWIVSDTGSRVILYDPVRGRQKSTKLKRKGKTVENAEGVALSPDGQKLYVVTDDTKKSRFLAYDIR